MQTNIQVTFQDVPPSTALATLIRKEAAALGRFFNGVVTCRVAVSEPHRHQRKGRPCRVRIHTAVPGDELVVDHEHGGRGLKTDAYVAVRHAFRAARRELEDYSRAKRGDVKCHSRPTNRHARPMAR